MNRANSSLPATAFVLSAVVSTLLFIVIPAWQLIGPGPFDWHLRQPMVVQGGLEALALLTLVGAGLALDRRWSLACLVAVPLALYLRRHAVEVPLLIDLAYLEIVIGLGALVLRLFGRPPPRAARDYLIAFVCGFLVWSGAAWSASALDHGSIRDLRTLTLLLAIPALLGRHSPLVLHLWRARRDLPAADRFWAGLLLGWIAVLYARSNVVFGHDALWYGLRPEYVLAPGRSVFEPLGLASPVHYFPKLYEVFLLPVSALNDSSVIVGMTLAMLALLLIACSQLAQRLDLPRRAHWPMLALVATLPALANSALYPKPDVAAVLFVLLCADAALAFLRSHSVGAAAWIVTCGLLACTAKLAAIPYVGMLVLATGMAAWRHRHVTAPASPRDVGGTRLALAMLALAMLVTGFVVTRTWLLAGMPTIGPDPLFRIWTALGLQLKPPAGTLEWTRSQDWSDVPALVVDWLFRPQRLPHVVTFWVGNVWLWCALLALAAARVASASPRRTDVGWPLGALMVTGLVLAVGVRYHVRGSDGNYFLFALVPAIVVAASALFARIATLPRAFAAALACLPVFALFQAGYSFVSAGWSPGTRMLDLDFTRSWHDTRALRWKILRAEGMAEIGRYLAARASEAPRVIGWADEPASFWLPARFEHIATIGFSHPDYVLEADALLAFMAAQGIDYLMLPNSMPESVPPAIAQTLRVAVERLRSDADVRRIDDGRYYLLDLSARHRREALDRQAWLRATRLPAARLVHPRTLLRDNHASPMVGAATSQNGTVAPSKALPRAAGTHSSAVTPSASQARSTLPRSDVSGAGNGASAAAWRRVVASGKERGDSSMVDSVI